VSSTCFRIEELPQFLDAVEASAWPRAHPVNYLTGPFSVGTVMGYEFREHQFYEVGKCYALPDSPGRHRC